MWGPHPYGFHAPAHELSLCTHYIQTDTRARHCLNIVVVQCVDGCIHDIGPLLTRIPANTFCTGNAAQRANVAGIRYSVHSANMLINCRAFIPRMAAPVHSVNFAATSPFDRWIYSNILCRAVARFLPNGLPGKRLHSKSTWYARQRQKVGAP